MSRHDPFNTSETIVNANITKAFFVLYFQTKSVDVPDGRQNAQSGEEQKIKKRKRSKKLKQVKPSVKALNKLEQSVLQPPSNLNYHQNRTAIANGNGMPKGSKYSDTLNIPTSSSHVDKAQNQSSQHLQEYSGSKSLPTNQILPINHVPVESTISSNPPSDFNVHTAWRKAGIVSQVVSKPAIARRKYTLEISDVGNPDGETEVYESTHL